MVLVGSLMSLIGYVLVEVYEDYRPREYVQWTMLNDEPDILGVVKSNKKTAEARSFDGIVWEENIKFYAQVILPENSVMSSCGGTPSQPGPQPNPEDPSTQPAQKWDWGFVKIKAGEANQITEGDAITVCVADTGIDLTHPDLKIDKYASFAGPYSGQHGHGTHVAGIIAAQNNQVGTRGVGSKIKIISAQVLGADGSGSLDGIAEGIKWCADNGAKVINMSLGGGGPTQLMYQAIIYAIQRGSVILAAAGNDGGYTNYPAAYQIPGLYAISATDQNDSITNFSSRGKIEFAAPGLNILSTVPMNGCDICSGQRGWGTMSGTSMATPYAAGAMALALSRDKLLQADAIGIPNYYGAGRINALKSVQ